MDKEYKQKCHSTGKYVEFHLRYEKSLLTYFLTKWQGLKVWLYTIVKSNGRSGILKTLLVGV